MHRLTFVIAVCVFAVRLQAGLIYESAESGATGQTSGSGILVSGDSYAAVNFEVTETVVTGRIGGHLLSFGGDIFAAVVALDGPLDVPDAPDLSGDDVLGVTAITPTDPSDNTSGNLRLTLTPGWYALVLGSQRFGVSGESALLNGNTLIGNPRIYSIRQSDGAVFLQSTTARFFVDTEPLPVLEKIADTDTAYPAGDGNFTAFGPATVRDGHVAFRATGLDDGVTPQESGVFIGGGGPLQTVVTTDSLIPGSDDAFVSFNSVVGTSDGNVVFQGRGPDERRGLYLFDGEAVSTVVEIGDEAPEQMGPFTSFWQWVSVHQRDVAFSGRNDETGVYATVNGTLTTIADPTTMAPDGLGPLSFSPLQFVSIENERVAFRAGREEPFLLGLFIGDGETLETVLDTTSTMPGGVLPVGFVGQGLLREGRVGFAAVDDLADPTDQAILLYDGSGTPQRIMDLNTPIPEDDGTFENFFEPSFDGRHFSWIGWGKGGSSATRGMYTNLTGEPTKVVAIGDTVDGKTVSSVSLTIESIDIYRIALTLQFEDGLSAGVFLAHYPAVGGDVDANGYVDLRDVAGFQVCFGDRDGPDCAEADFNGDFRVDLRDHIAFCWSGPGIVPVCE